MVIFQVLEKNQFDTGSVHQMFQAATGLRERGHSVVILSREGEALRRGCEQQGVEFQALRLRHQLDLQSIGRFRALVQARRPEVIHVHKGLSHSIALAATLRDRVSVFIVNRGVSFPLTIWNRAKYRTRRVDRIVAVCEQIRQVLIHTGKLEPERIELIYAATDTSLFSPERWDPRDFRAEKSMDPEAFLVAQVGVRDWKGWRDLVDAFAVIHRKHSHTRLALIDCKNKEQENEVRSYAAERGAGSAVLPVEYRADMARVLSAADVVVDASWAGTGITGTIREAMALRKPVIATDCGGNRELLSSPAVGWLIPARNEQALVAALLEVIEDREGAREVAKGAREHVRANFSKERRIDALEALYTSVVSQK